MRRASPTTTRCWSRSASSIPTRRCASRPSTDSRSTSTETAARRKIARAGALLATLALLVAPQAAAHKPGRVTAREFVRLSGSYTAQEEGGAAPDAERTLAVAVQGQERRFAASDWQVFALVSEEREGEVPPLPARITLQGARELTARVAGARADQRVSILAERRPGSGELFLLAADLCPAD